jgi:hypothetical protein
MGRAVPPLPNTPSWRGAQLGGAKGQLYLLPYFLGTLGGKLKYVSGPDRVTGPR